MKDLIVQGYGISDKGLLRSTNEDCYSIQDYIFMVADGMGGHNAGEIASKLTIESILKDSQYIFTSKRKNQEFILDYKKLILKIINNANKKVIQKAKKNTIYKGMGTTLVLALFQKPNIMHIANIGDSRAYLFRKNKLIMISEDHSLAKVLSDNLNLKNNQKNNRYKNYLTRAIGIYSKISPYYQQINVISEDKILLCSDGLWNMVTETDIINILNKKISDQLKCKEFIKKANNKGGFDNITAVIISVICP
jgi:protein phosphatase